MICPKCDYDSVPDGTHFCPNCGQRITEVAKPPAQIHVAQEVGRVESGSVTAVKVGQIIGDVTIKATIDRSIEIPRPPEPNRPPDVGGFVGREAELARLADELAASHRVMITGMAGVGKTALAAVLARRVGVPERTFWHTFHKGEGVDVLTWKMAAFLAWHGQEDLWQLLQGVRQSGGQPPPPEVLLDYLLQTIRGQDYLLCLDDFQLVDEDPLLAHLVKRLQEMVLAGELDFILSSRRPPAFAPMAQVRTLAGLDGTDTRRLLDRRGLSLSDDLVAELHARTEGNAQLLILAIDALQCGTTPHRFISRLTETVDIEHYLMTEVDGGLDEEERAVMGAVAVLLGYPGTGDAIELVLDGGSVRRVLRDLCRRYLLTVREGEAGREYGQHAMVQDFYYDLLGRRERQDMHLRAGEYYELEEPDRLRAARHFLQARAYSRAVSLATADVGDLIVQGQARSLVLLLKRFAPQQVDAAQWSEVNVARGQVYSFLQEGQPARESYQEALAHLDALPDTAATRECRARVCRGLGGLLEYEAPSEALAWLHRGLDQVGASGAVLEADLYLKMGSVHMVLGDYAAALEAVERGLALLPEGLDWLRAAALVNEGIIRYWAHGDIEQGRACWQRALAISQQLHDHWMMLRIWHNLGIATELAGDWSDATAEYHKALALAEQLGSAKHRVVMELALGIVETAQGHDGVARQHLSNCVTMAQEYNLTEYRVAGLASRADLHLRRGEVDAAVADLAEAEPLALALGAEDQLAEIYRGRAQARLSQGEHRAALEDAERSLNLAREVGLDFEEGLSLRVLGQAHLAGNQSDQAEIAFEQSLEILASRDPYEAARTRMSWGRALLGGPQEERGIALLQEARIAFQELGAGRDLAALEEILV